MGLANKVKEEHLRETVSTCIINLLDVLFRLGVEEEGWEKRGDIYGPGYKAFWLSWEERLAPQSPLVILQPSPFNQLLLKLLLPQTVSLVPLNLLLLLSKDVKTECHVTKAPFYH